MKRRLTIGLAMLLTVATYAMERPSTPCPYSTDYSASSINIPSVGMVYVPMEASVSMNTTVRKPYATHYSVHQMYSTGKSYKKNRQYVYGGRLLSEQGFTTTSAYRQNETGYTSADNYLAAASLSVSVRKAPPGGGHATGEWLPLSDAWYFLTLLALGYAFHLHHRRKQTTH